MEQALSDIYEFIELVRSGEFYSDYDQSTECLGKADKAFKLIEQRYREDKSNAAS
jgi:hypothetical protein